MSLRTFVLAAALAALPAADGIGQSPEVATADGLPVADGQTVALLGDAFFEREGNASHIESLLTASIPDRRVKFRNLGWSGDTPRCESRSYFGPPAEGFERLTEQLSDIKPSAVICCYGAVDSFRGEAGLEDFLTSYRRLLDMVQKTTGAPVILLSPPPARTLPPPFPDLAEENRRRALYRDAIRALAAERKAGFGDVFAAVTPTRPETVNGVTFTDDGYRTMAPAFVRALGIAPRPDAGSPAMEKLREAVAAKNRMFFHRWRPQNEIYLFGSRKHEQGNNSVEIPQFDPLIDRAESEIARLAAALPPASVQ